jgi:hypothetical protein
MRFEWRRQLRRVSLKQSRGHIEIGSGETQQPQFNVGLKDPRKSHRESKRTAKSSAQHVTCTTVVAGFQ